MGNVTLAADRAVDPLLVRAYRSGRLRAYAVRDQFGWAVMARVPVPDDPEGRSAIVTVQRYEQQDSGSALPQIRALAGLAQVAASRPAGPLRHWVQVVEP